MRNRFELVRDYRDRFARLSLSGKQSLFLRG